MNRSAVAVNPFLGAVIGGVMVVAVSVIVLSDWLGDDNRGATTTTEADPTTLLLHLMAPDDGCWTGTIKTPRSADQS